MDRIKRAWTYLAIEEYDARHRAASLAEYEAMLERACGRIAATLACSVAIETVDHAMREPMRDAIESATPPVLNVVMKANDVSLLCRVALANRDLAMLTVRLQGRRQRGGETELVLQGVHGDTLDTLSLSKHLATPVATIHTGRRSVPVAVALRVLDVLCPLLHASTGDIESSESFITQSLESSDPSESSEAELSDTCSSTWSSRASTATYDSDLH